jgi:hypothetical protein
VQRGVASVGSPRRAHDTRKLVDDAAPALTGAALLAEDVVSTLFAEASCGADW